MRIVVANWNDRKIGGAETYLADLLPALVERGVEIAVWCEQRSPLERDSIVPDGVPSWCAEEMGRDRSLAALRQWSPDLLYVHGMVDPENEATLQAVAPAVFYAHNYHGTCITGAKTRSRPSVEPCDRRFGYGCLAQFYPRRCGGRSPLTMWSNFRVQARRLELLAGYRAVLCASEHMRHEYLRHGLEEERVHLVPYPIRAVTQDGSGGAAPAVRAAGDAWQILCAGRLERQKGVAMLLQALPRVRAQLGVPLRVVIAGDGAERAGLQAAAFELAARDPDLAIHFVGWVDGATLHQLTRQSDLLAVPSLWPEPFGMIGLEAGQLGVPTAAFDVGGIGDWLRHGVNGMLAPGSPATAEGFASAIVGCLDPVAHPALAEGARAAARRFTMDAHLDRLETALDAHGLHLAGVEAARPALGTR